MKKISAILLTLMLVLGMIIPTMLTASADTPATWDGKANIKWYVDAGKGAGLYELNTAQDLAGFAYLVCAGNANGPYSGVYYDSQYNVLGLKASGKESQYAVADRLYEPVSGDGSQEIAGDMFFDQMVNLTSDIVLNEGDASTWATTAPANKGWLPIGGERANAATGSGFDGIFDGKGHTVSGLYYAGADDHLGAGLFGYVGRESNAIIQNLTVENFYVKAGLSVGGIVGHARRGVNLENCFAKNGSVTAVDTQAGGLVGGAFSVASAKYCGVENVNINTLNRSAGFFGAINNLTLEVTDSYVIGSKIKMTGSDAGVIVGLSNNSSIKVTNVYSTLEIEVVPAEAPAEGEAPVQNVGLVWAGKGGNSAPSVTVSGLYYVDSIGNTATGKDTEGVSAIELDAIKGENAKTTLLGFDFDTVWVTVADGTPKIDLDRSSTGGDSGDDGNSNAGSSDNGNNGNSNKTEDTTAKTDDTTAKEDDTTETPTEEKKGCGSSIGMASVALMAVACGAVVVSKKKEN